MSDQDTHKITLRMICIHPPEFDNATTYFGLQDKANDLQPGTPRADGALEFTCTLSAAQQPGSGSPNFTGSFAHGTPAERFLYLSLGTNEGGAWNWLRRIKVPLKAITWELVEAAHTRVLQTTVDGRQAATVKLPDGWEITD
ncbi:MAG: DUF5990 family protein [bacterium]|nr:DUF5990 family protein [bacterium]